MVEPKVQRNHSCMNPVSLTEPTDMQKKQEIPTASRCPLIVKGTRGVQHGVWTHLHAFWIIRESIDIPGPQACDDSAKIVKAPNGGQHEM